MKTVKITCSENQARLIQQALDLHSRLQCGQISSLKSFFFSDCDWHEEEELLRKLKELYFPELHSNESYGIFSSSAPETSKIGWDMIQCIRYELRDRNNKNYTVDQYPAMRSSKKEELIKVEVSEDDE